MNPRVLEVKAGRDFTIEILFTNKERKVFDVKPYLDKGIFKELKSKDVFNSVRADNGSVSWNGGQDFCPDTLYLEGRAIN